jgi:AraC-like DNA-binding protein
MPQFPDALPQFLDETHRRTLHQLFAEYQITNVTCLYWRNRAPWGVPWRVCPDSFCLFPQRGRVRVYLEGTQKVLGPGEFMMLPEGVAHALEIVGSGRLELISLHCHLADQWRRPFLSGFTSPFGRLNAPSHWTEALKELTCLLQTDPEVGQLRGEGLVRELVSVRLRQAVSFALRPAGGDSRIQSVLERMEREWAVPELAIEALACEVKLSGVQLRKLFRRQTGTSPRHYLQQLRLRKSGLLLWRSSQSIKQVAAACGFASDHYFHRVFRQAFGRTPLEYRRGKTRPADGQV